MASLTKYKVVLKMDNNVVLRTYTSSKRRLVNKVRGKQWNIAILTTTYYVGGIEVGYNEATCLNMNSFLKALDAFTEADLLLT